MNLMTRRYVLQMLILVLPVPALGIEERIEFDNSTGNYVIWEDVNGVLEPAIFVPATKVNPTIVTKVHTNTVELRYDYVVKNLKDSEQSIETIIFDATGIDSLVLGSSNWKHDALLSGVNSTTKVGLVYWGEDDGGIAPGGKLAFTVNSHNLAGIGRVTFQGASAILKFHGYGVGPKIQAELDELMMPERNSVHRYTVAPAIVLSAKPNVRNVLLRMIAHVEALVADGLMDTLYAQTLVRYLQSAADAESNGNKSGVLHNLGLAKSHLSSHKDKHGSEHREESDDDMMRRGVQELLSKAYLFNIRYIHKLMDANHDVKQMSPVEL